MILVSRNSRSHGIIKSILAAYVVFGFSAKDPRKPCLNPFKWSPVVTHTLRFLGYMIDTRKMTVQWPCDKRAQLAAMFNADWLSPTAGKNPTLTPRQIA